MHVAHGQPLPAKTDSCCTPGLPGPESLSEHSNGLLCPSPEGNSSIIWQGGPQLALCTLETHHGALCTLFLSRPLESCKAPDKLWGRELFSDNVFQFHDQTQERVRSRCPPLYLHGVGKLMCTGQRELPKFNTCGWRVRDSCVCVPRYKWEVNLCAHREWGTSTTSSHGHGLPGWSGRSPVEQEDHGLSQHGAQEQRVVEARLPKQGRVNGEGAEVFSDGMCPGRQKETWLLPHAHQQTENKSLKGPGEEASPDSAISHIQSLITIISPCPQCQSVKWGQCSLIRDPWGC